jgi:translocation and assembly module TamB
MSLVARYSSKLDRLDVAEFLAMNAYGTVDASGRVEEPLGGRRIELNGKLAPDFAAITALLARKVEPGAKISGRPRTFEVKGSLGESSGGWHGLDAEFGFDLLGADIYGMKFGASPVVLRARNGKLAFDPISTTINDGHLRLEPELDLDATGGPLLRLGKNSTIREARINDEVSERVLAYVAPLLAQSTRASGLVSVDLDHAEFPIGSGRGRQAKVEGAVVFEDVEFAPGPLAGEILSVIGRRELRMKLDEPVTLTIADGRINQRGLSIPIGDLTRVELSGWVDFDRKIGLVASVPVTPSMLGNNPLLSDIAAGTRVRLPIGGTLDNPKVDREAFAQELQELGKTLLTRGATRGALELLMRLSKPKDPNAPPPPPRLTPQEKKAQRQERKAIRRGEIPPAQSDLPKS